MKNLFKSARYYWYFTHQVQRKYWKGSWTPECLNSEFGQGSERKVERGQAIPLNYFKEENKEPTVMQKQYEKILHTPPKPLLCFGCFLCQSYPTGTFPASVPCLTLHFASAPWSASWNASCWRGCCCHGPCRYCWQAPQGPCPGDFLPWLSSVTQLPWRVSLSTGPLSFVLCYWALCKSYSRTLLSLSPFSSAPALVSPRDNRSLSSPLAEKINSSTPLSTTLPPNNNNLTLVNNHEFSGFAFSFSASQGSETRNSLHQKQVPIPQYQAFLLLFHQHEKGHIEQSDAPFRSTGWSPITFSIPGFLNGGLQSMSYAPGYSSVMSYHS